MARSRSQAAGAVYEQLLLFPDRAEFPPPYERYSVRPDHWRDRRRHEVDLMVESDGGLIAIEVKRAREVPRGATAGIDAFHERYPERFHRGLVMYAGRHVLPLADDTWAVPISALWA